MRLGRGRLLYAHGEQLNVIELELNKIDNLHENQRCLRPIYASESANSIAEEVVVKRNLIGGGNGIESK